MVGISNGGLMSRLLAVALTASAILASTAALPAQAEEDTAAIPMTVGANSLGQQGDGTASSRSLPGSTDGPPAVAIASGRDHAYLLDVTGQVWGWGDNQYGQVGDGTTTVRRAPVRLPLTDVVRIEAGHYHGLAVRADGTVWTWGYGALGQLGLGTTTNRTTPTQVPGLVGVTGVAGGRDMSYAVRADGSVLAWGNNANGEIGDGTTTRRPSPVGVPGLTGVAELGAGRNHVLARTVDGRLWAWGDNAYGQVGDGTLTDRYAPVEVLATGVAAVDAGAHHSVALRSDGTVATWGRGYRGQLGLGTTSNRTAPTPVPGLSGIVEVGDGRDQSFAVTAAGQVWAWGSNDAGQLGDGTVTTRNSPVLLGLDGIVAVQSGSSHTVFLPAGGPVPNQPPTPAFALTCSGLSCSVDAAASQDPDGTIQSYSIDFGDGTVINAPMGQHPYAVEGSYTVTLTVIDDDGASASLARVATVSDLPPVAVDHVSSAGSNANAVTHRVTVPATAAAGDELILAITVNNAGAIGAPTGLNGWRNVVEVQGADIRTRVWARTAVAGDGGRTLSVALQAIAKGSLTVSVYRGSGPLAITGGAGLESVARAQHTTPLIAVPVDGSRLVSMWSDKSSATTTMTPPAGTAVRLLTTGSSSGRITTLVADSATPTGVAGSLTAVANSASAKATMVSLVVSPLG